LDFEPGVVERCFSVVNDNKFIGISSAIVGLEIPGDIGFFLTHSSVNITVIRGIVKIPKWHAFRSTILDFFCLLLAI